MNRLIDIIAKLLAAIFIFVVCATAGLILYFKFIERPTEIRSDGEVVGKGLGHVKGKTNLKPGFTLEFVPNRDEGVPIIDIQPDGGGMEGELDREELTRSVRTRPATH